MALKDSHYTVSFTAITTNNFMRRFLQFSLFAICLLCLSISAISQISINEYSAANENIVTDNSGSNEDFIELYNAGSSDVNLGGYTISDKQDNPGKYQFPGTVNIPANGHLLIWCSGRNTAFGGAVHTNFKLTQTKASEYLVLSDPSGTILDEIDVNPTLINHARAKVTDGDTTWGLATNPTPGASNQDVRTDYAVKPVANMAPGLYSGSIDVTLSSSGNDIYYTLDGDRPTAGSNLYSGAITISSTSVLRAIAISSNPLVEESFIETNTYFINDEHTLPVISIAGGDEGETLDDLLDGSFNDPIGSFEYFDANQNLIDEGLGEFNKHGNDSWAYDQRGFDYIAQDEFGYHDAVRHQIFPNKDRDKFQRLIVKAAANDNHSFQDGAHVRDLYVHELSQRGKLKLDERSGVFCILYLNGEYWGVYDVREKVDDSDFTNYYYDQSKDNIQYIKTWGATWAEYGGNDALDDWGDLNDFIINNDMSNDANYDVVKQQLNVGSLVDYMIINTQVVCADWLNWNTAWWRGLDPDGDKKKWRYTLWDMDASFGHYANYTGVPETGAEADPCDIEAPSVDDPQGHTDMLTSLLENEDFKNLYVNRYADLNNSIFSCDYMLGLLDEMVATIQPEMQRQLDTWGGTMASWDDSVQELRDFIEERCTVINEGIADCYDVEGPFELTVDVNDTDAGLVEVNTITPEADEYVWSGEYFDGAPVTLTAEPEDCFQLDYWEVTNNDTGVTETYTTESVEIPMDVSYSAVAYFVAQDGAIVINLDPIGMDAEIIVNGETIDADDLPFEECFNEGDEIELEVIPGPDTIFGGWQNDDGPLDSSNSTTYTYTVGTEGDNISAFFITETFDITFNIEPAGTGTFTINGTDVDTETYTDEFAGGSTITLEATANEHYEFDGWYVESDPSVNSNNSEFDFTITQDETIVVSFTPVNYSVEIVLDDTLTQGGSIVINGQTYTSGDVIVVDLPYGTEISIQALADEGFVFDSWASDEFTINEIGNGSNASFEVTGPGTITVFFTEKPPVCINLNPSAFTPNFDGVNDNFVPLFFDCDIVDYQIDIFDRWGNVVFSSADSTAGWNGKNDKGENVNMGVYIFQVKFSYNSFEGDFREDVVGGNITVLR